MHAVGQPEMFSGYQQPTSPMEPPVTTSVNQHQQHQVVSHQQPSQGSHQPHQQFPGQSSQSHVPQHPSSLEIGVTKSTAPPPPSGHQQWAHQSQAAIHAPSPQTTVPMPPHHVHHQTQSSWSQQAHQQGQQHLPHSGSQNWTSYPQGRGFLPGKECFWGQAYESQNSVFRCVH